MHRVRYLKFSKYAAQTFHILQENIFALHSDAFYNKSVRFLLKERTLADVS